MRLSRHPALIVAAWIGASCAAGEHDHRSSPRPISVIERLTTSFDIDGRRIGAVSTTTRATAIVVFASWCGPCRSELAILGDIAQRSPQLRVIGLNAYEEWGKLSDERRLRAYLAEFAPWLRVVHADAELLSALGGVPKIPSLFLFDRSGISVGEFRRAKRRPPTRDELERAVARALACPVPGPC